MSYHYVLRYRVTPDYLERRPQFRTEHLQLAWESFHRGDLLIAGPVGEPVTEAHLIFNNFESAEAFAQRDPYVTQGLVESWEILKWETVVGKDARTPLHP